MQRCLSCDLPILIPSYIVNVGVHKVATAFKPNQSVKLIRAQAGIFVKIAAYMVA